jgi:intracellular sulfur oxidation DsrE/DsrF family protein
MSEIDRRHLVGALVAGGAAVVASGTAHAAPVDLAMQDLKKEADAACLYHCDFGDSARFSQQLRNIGNHLAIYNFDPFALKIVIVAHAAGIKFFLADLAGTPWAEDQIDPDLDKRMKALAQHGVEVYLCRVTFANLKIDPAKARSDRYIKFVPSGIATAAALQGKGFAYLKVG